MDRNAFITPNNDTATVALHPEGVDRNSKGIDLSEHQGTSPSTRRAWIEIVTVTSLSPSPSVALHPEGVDRNYFAEMTKMYKNYEVALHPEGVDRNR